VNKVTTCLIKEAHFLWNRFSETVQSKLQSMTEFHKCIRLFHSSLWQDGKSATARPNFLELRTFMGAPARRRVNHIYQSDWSPQATSYFYCYQYFTTLVREICCRTENIILTISGCDYGTFVFMRDVKDAQSLKGDRAIWRRDKHWGCGIKITFELWSPSIELLADLSAAQTQLVMH